MTHPDKTILSAMRKMLAYAETDSDFILPNVIQNYGTGSRTECQWFPFATPEDEARIGAAVRRAIGGTWKKTYGEYVRLTHVTDDITYVIILDRAQVCRRVVTDVQTVTETVPDPDAIIPTVEMTKEVEIFEWVCDPLIAD